MWYFVVYVAERNIDVGEGMENFCFRFAMKKEM